MFKYFFNIIILIMLYICSTPIGNLNDVSFRLIETLKKCEFIVCEDTRRCKILLKKFNIKNKKIIICNEFNEKKIKNKIISLLKKDKEIALISDSGTPLISDPGFEVVREAIRNNIKITSIPGPCSLISALTISGLPTNKFAFYGFLPKSINKRKKIFESLKESNITSIFFESPHRIIPTLKIINEILKDRLIVLVKELTKMHEKVIRGNANEIINLINKDKKLIKGEFVLLIAPKGYKI